MLSLLPTADSFTFVISCVRSHLRFCTCTAVKFSLLLNNRCVVSLRFENFWINYLTCTSRCRRRGKERLCGSCGFFLEEWGQSTIFVLTDFIVSSSPARCRVGYHVHPICILSQASSTPPTRHLFLLVSCKKKNNGLTRNSHTHLKYNGSIPEASVVKNAV